ncbi:MAG: flagellar hook-associated protein FlgK, partial [Deltaproteobacteria bacterium]|nr:flagellar hook-associated protein FlgK [Deltaproteobacteria bacterium]
GDATIATAIANLQTTNLMNSGASTIDNYYSSLVSQIGLDVDSADSSYKYQSNLSELYTNYRESVSGVSSDEEAANLTQYQAAYQACAKVATVLQAIMKTVIEM